jgi:hypothetical protein
MKVTRLFVPVLILIFLSGVVITGISSCRHDDDIGSLDTICFQTEILPIFQTSCATSGCHDSGELNLSDYSGIRGAVTPGSPEKSEIYKAMVNIWSPEMMPPDRPLSLENRTKIKVWIEQGANETKCP